MLPDICRSVRGCEGDGLITIERAEVDREFIRFSYELRNSDAIRCNCMNTEKFTPQEHQKHMSFTFDTFFYILADGKKVGYLRIEPTSNEIGIYLSDRGKGYGSAALELLKERRSHILLKIRPHNTACLRMAEKCGFKKIAEIWEWNE